MNIVYFIKPYRITDGLKYLLKNNVRVEWLTKMGAITFKGTGGIDEIQGN